MSDERYYPQTGDYVEATVTVRGRVTRLPRCNWFKVGEEWSFEDEEVEVGEWKFTKVVPPLPTTPGSVIRSKFYRSTWHLHTDGKWHSMTGVTSPGWSTPEDFDVIFDAGAS